MSRVVFPATYLFMLSCYNELQCTKGTQLFVKRMMILFKNYFTVTYNLSKQYSIHSLYACTTSCVLTQLKTSLV